MYFIDREFEKYEPKTLQRMPHVQKWAQDKMGYSRAARLRKRLTHAAALLRGGHRAHRLGHRKEDNVDGDQRQHSTDRERQRLVAHQPALLEQVAV